MWAKRACLWCPSLTYMHAWQGAVQGDLQREVEAVPDLPTKDVAIERLADSLYLA